MHAAQGKPNLGHDGHMMVPSSSRSGGHVSGRPQCRQVSDLGVGGAGLTLPLGARFRLVVGQATRRVEMKIGELAKRAGVSPKAVRRYEELGLLSPRRMSNGYRDFDEDHVRIARELRSLRELGITAERTRPILECLDSSAAESDECPSSLAEYASAIDDLTARITELTDRRAVLLGRLREAAYRNSVARPDIAPSGLGASSGECRTEPAGQPRPRGARLSHRPPPAGGGIARHQRRNGPDRLPG
jgi:DNA-binding transcriptional MerR regulator